MRRRTPCSHAANPGSRAAPRRSPTGTGDAACGEIRAKKRRRGRREEEEEAMEAWLSFLSRILSRN
jgi:hypothetical protein